MLDRS